MAQTVSIQRGSVTYTARGDNSTSNITTLFTNTSSGSGTRVIINYLTVQNPYVSGGGIDQSGARCSGHLGSVSSGTTGTMIGSMTTNQTYTSTYQMPISDPGATSVGGSTNVYSAPRFNVRQAGSNQVGYSASFPTNIQSSVSDTANFGNCPRTFWIGPSDVLKWWPLNSTYTTPSGKSTITSYYTQTLYYSFTCITES